MNIWEEPVRGGYPDPRMLGLSGLEGLRHGDLVARSMVTHRGRTLAVATGSTMIVGERPAV